MQKILMWSLLTIASLPTYAENIVATITYDNKKKQIISLISNTKNIDKLTECVKMTDTKEGQKRIKDEANKKKEKIIEIKFPCDIHQRK
ncbi:hypothetical protein RFI41_15935 [Acinetobacter nosocomialis]|uniref:hypothetical protein n=1 Tax=Acinetobacter nosocomialis TaxID=106654 RepID=UPI00280FDAC5|nr:hypothetical protein [Acinetobacter nosocomialis]MDQ8804201.1 hypothetical protein [Acinetobacter nosocomialis]MDQ8850355.1 hypothetical protein [Acinetobacter nosocomialis]MDQ8850365.1 hypothetical protein [Acinetobacter nosocomialis]MDQ8854452.1 hypothetical protein [Acinetobacter nosocomialis]MDQ8894522.1 hypothetical protein [Acinetobacter nosocomialis]